MASSFKIVLKTHECLSGVNNSDFQLSCDCWSISHCSKYMQRCSSMVYKNVYIRNESNVQNMKELLHDDAVQIYCWLNFNLNFTTEL